MAFLLSTHFPPCHLQRSFPRQSLLQSILPHSELTVVVVVVVVAGVVAAVVVDVEEVVVTGGPPEVVTLEKRINRRAKIKWLDKPKKTKFRFLRIYLCKEYETLTSVANAFALENCSWNGCTLVETQSLSCEENAIVVNGTLKTRTSISSVEFSVIINCRGCLKRVGSSCVRSLPPVLNGIIVRIQGKAIARGRPIEHVIQVR
mmetsp:Transcript_1940/g.4282  ORF Transcript_1940/g.4282 Transcript_1940/m.4282 type:complete len:203 (-) Transcript_1940:21-629(-)